MMIAKRIVFQFPDHFLIKFNMQLCAAGILLINAVHNLANKPESLALQAVKSAEYGPDQRCLQPPRHI